MQGTGSYRGSVSVWVRQTPGALFSDDVEGTSKPIENTATSEDSIYRKYIDKLSFIERLEKASITIYPSPDGPSKETYGIDFSPVVEVLTADAVGNNEAASIPHDAEPIPHLADDPAEVAWWTAAQDVHILAFTTRGGGGWGGGIFSGNQPTNQPTLFLREPLI